MRNVLYEERIWLKRRGRREVRYGGKREKEKEEEEANREGEAKERACFSARDVPRLPQTRLNSPDANTPIPVTREALPNGIIRWIYLLPRDPEKTSRGSPCGTLERERERGRDREPVRYIEPIRNWYSDSGGSRYEYMQRTRCLHILNLIRKQVGYR